MTLKNRFCVTTVQGGLTHRSILLSCFQAKQSALPPPPFIEPTNPNSEQFSTFTAETVFQPENTPFGKARTYKHTQRE